MVRTKICVEGGGGKALNVECRKAFVALLTKAGVSRRAIDVEACGSRGEAFKTFSAEYSRGSPSILLVDAEGPVIARSTWQHLKGNDNWSRPDGATDDQCHLMVQGMESWLLTDADALRSFYGQGFRTQSLPKNPNIELVSKQDASNGLKHATRNTRKGSYKKGRDSFKILEIIEPSKVMSASSHARRFIKTLSGK